MNSRRIGIYRPFVAFRMIRAAKYFFWIVFICGFYMSMELRETHELLDTKHVLAWGYPLSSFSLALVMLLSNRAVPAGRLAAQAKYGKPVLLLRPFAEDEHFRWWRYSRVFLFSTPLGAIQNSESRFSRLLSRAGPLIALVSPKMKTAPPGISGIVATETWKDDVTALLGQAQAVIVRAGRRDNIDKGENFWWEVEQCVANVRPEKLLIWLPRTRDVREYDRLRHRIDPFLPKPLPTDAGVVRFILFDENWNARLIERTPKLLAVARCLFAPISFITSAEQNYWYFKLKGWFRQNNLKRGLPPFLMDLAAVVLASVSLSLALPLAGYHPLTVWGIVNLRSTDGFLTNARKQLADLKAARSDEDASKAVKLTYFAAGVSERHLKALLASDPTPEVRHYFLTVYPELFQLKLAAIDEAGKRLEVIASYKSVSDISLDQKLLANEALKITEEELSRAKEQDLIRYLNPRKTLFELVARNH